MSEAKKPRLCEILGVEVGEEFWFRFKGSNPKTYYIGENGVMYCEEEGGYAISYTVCYVINHPEEIIRMPPLTGTEFAICKAIGAKWVSKDDNDNWNADLWDEKPLKYGKIYYTATADGHILARVSAHLFPSVKPGNCICVEGMGGETGAAE